jgi:hypothetical protein
MNPYKALKSLISANVGAMTKAMTANARAQGPQRLAAVVTACPAAAPSTPPAGLLRQQGYWASYGP